MQLPRSAVLVATDKFQESDKDFGFEESLWKDGETFYLQGKGGKLTKWGGAPGVKTINQEQATKWMESHFNSMEVK